MKTSLVVSLAALLAFALVSVAHAGRDHEHRGKTVHMRHDGERGHGSPHDRHRRSAARSDDHRHHRFHEAWHHDHYGHKVVWQRRYQHPHLYIRLPWLIYID